MHAPGGIQLCLCSVWAEGANHCSPCFPKVWPPFFRGLCAYNRVWALVSKLNKENSKAHWWFSPPLLTPNILGLLLVRTKGLSPQHTCRDQEQQMAAGGRCVLICSGRGWVFDVYKMSRCLQSSGDLSVGAFISLILFLTPK